jgi:hypothetical protein
MKVRAAIVSANLLLHVQQKIAGEFGWSPERFRVQGRCHGTPHREKARPSPVGTQAGNSCAVPISRERMTEVLNSSIGGR